MSEQPDFTEDAGVLMDRFGWDILANCMIHDIADAVHTDAVKRDNVEFIEEYQRLWKTSLEQPA